MNEQIKQLAGLAGIHQPDRFDANDGSNQLERFAELVAEACADYMTSQRYMVLRPCEAVTPEASVARIESSVKSLARGIARGEWKKHMKGVE